MSPTSTIYPGDLVFHYIFLFLPIIICHPSDELLISSPIVDPTLAKPYPISFLLQQCIVLGCWTLHYVFISVLSMSSCGW